MWGNMKWKAVTGGKGKGGKDNGVSERGVDEYPTRPDETESISRGGNIRGGGCPNS